MRLLEGVFVLDFSTLLPGPMATLLLAEAGAEVVKVERPGTGEDMRAYPPLWGRDSINFALLNRGKKSLALNLKAPADRAKLQPLLKRADVIVEQFRPGVMERLGLGYKAVSAINPRIIYCSITGYGQSGPKRDTAGHDLNYIGDSGLLSLSHGSVDRPVLPPALIADIAGGAYPAVMNILLALREREASGHGRHLDISMTDNLFPFLYWAMGSGLTAGRWPAGGGELVTGGSPRYQLYRTSDDQLVAAAPLEQKFWDTFCDLIGADAAIRDDARDPAAAIAGVARIIASEPAAHWRSCFAGKDCCCSIVADLQSALEDPHFQARGIFAHDLVGDDGRLTTALPVPIDPGFRAPAESVLSAPALGAHNSEFAPESKES